MGFENRFLTSDKPGKGLVWDDSDGKLAKAFEKSKENEAKERKEKLAIPEEAKPGSADMAFYTTRNTITINEYALKKAEKNHTPDKYRLRDLIIGQEKQQDLLRSILKENMSAMEAYEVIQQKIDKWEEMLAENEHSVTGAQMKAAKDLQATLLAEASRDVQK